MALSECFNGNHDLQVIIAVPNNYDGDRIVRWCRVCGSVVVDIEVDNRLMANQVKMKAPLITREALAVHQTKGDRPNG